MDTRCCEKTFSFTLDVSLKKPHDTLQLTLSATMADFCVCQLLFTKVRRVWLHVRVTRELMSVCPCQTCNLVTAILIAGVNTQSLRSVL